MADEKHKGKKKRHKSLSFEAITEEIGDVVIPVSEKHDGAASEDPTHEQEMSGTVIIEDDYFSEVAPPDEDVNLRVLTGSSPKPRPMWVDSLFSGILAALIIMPVVLRIGSLQYYQPWISYMTMLLALGAGLWALLGLRQEDTTAGKRMCYAGAILNLVVLLTAFLVRMPVTR